MVKSTNTPQHFNSHFRMRAKYLLFGLNRKRHVVLSMVHKASVSKRLSSAKKGKHLVENTDSKFNCVLLVLIESYDNP